MFLTFDLLFSSVFPFLLPFSSYLLPLFIQFILQIKLKEFGTDCLGLVFCMYKCYCLQTLRDSVSPVCSSFDIYGVLKI